MVFVGTELASICLIVRRREIPERKHCEIISRLEFVESNGSGCLVLGRLLFAPERVCAVLC